MDNTNASVEEPQAFEETLVVATVVAVVVILVITVVVVVWIVSRTPSRPQEAGSFGARVADRVQDIYHKYFNVSDSDAPQGTLLAGRPQQAAMERQGSIYNEKDAKKKSNDDGVTYYR